MQIREIALLKKLKERSENEVRSFDIALSGTSASLVIQIPKKVIIGWVGDSLVALRKDEKLTKNTNKSQIVTVPSHTAVNPSE